MSNPAVQQDWTIERCTIQQQSVLLMACRGPDGMKKHHPVKALIRAYRACVLNAASTGRPIELDAEGDTFMDKAVLRNPENWSVATGRYFRNIDAIPHHYSLHLIHGAQILGYKYPNTVIATRWLDFYYEAVEDMHLYPESEAQMDARLSDFGRLG